MSADFNGVTIAQLAETIRAGDIASVRTMLDARPELVNMEMAYADEHRPIHFAVLARAPEMVRLLMQRGADARRGIHPHRDATTALVIATERGYAEIVAIIEEEEEEKRRGLMDRSAEASPTRSTGTTADC